MAELWKYPKEEQRFLSAFPVAYNTAHKTTFDGPVERAGKREEGWDYRWRDPNHRQNLLEVQVTVAGSDPLSERVHPPNAGNIADAIRRHMESAGYVGYVLSLEAQDTPRNEAFREKLTAYVCNQIDRHVAVGLAEGESVRFDAHWEHGVQNNHLRAQIARIKEKIGPQVVGSIGVLHEEPK